MKVPKHLTAEELGGQVAALKKLPGWAHLVARHAKQIEAVQGRINDLSTSPAETQEYKRALWELKLSSPDALAQDLMTTARNAATRATPLTARTQP